MDSSYRCQNCDEKGTWLEQSLYKAQLIAWDETEINRIGTCIK